MMGPWLSALVYLLQVPPKTKTSWGEYAESNAYADVLSLVIVEPRKHEWMRPVLMNACHVWGGSGKNSVLVVICTASFHV